MRLTVGPLPPAVYWRRRAIVLGAALVALFVVAQACMSASPADDQTSGGGGDPSTGAPTTTTASPDGNEPAAAPGTTGPPPATSGPDGQDGASEAPAEDSCTDDEIEVTARAARTTFAVGESVQFTIRIAHEADRPCERDVGGGQRELYLTPDPGSGHVWSSRDCADPSGKEVLQLSTRWEREHHINFVGRGGRGCDQELEPGKYQLFARLGTAKSEPVEITLQ